MWDTNEWRPRKPGEDAIRWASRGAPGTLLLSDPSRLSSRVSEAQGPGRHRGESALPAVRPGSHSFPVSEKSLAGKGLHAGGAQCHAPAFASTRT